MHPIWAVPVALLVLGVLPLAYLLREVARELRDLRVTLARAGEVQSAVAALRADLDRRPGPEVPAQ